MKSRPTIRLYIGAFIEDAPGRRPHDCRVSPIFESTEEPVRRAVRAACTGTDGFNQWLQATQRVTAQSITLTFRAQHREAAP